MEWLICLVYATVFAFLLWRSNALELTGAEKLVVPAIFILKCTAGIAYCHYLLDTNRGGDMFWYMYETNYLFDSCRQHPELFFKYLFGIEDESTRQFTGIITTWNKSDFLVNDARTLIRINLVIRLISFGAWQVHTVVFCLISTIGFIYLAKFFSAVFSSGKLIMTLAVFLVPSVFLWTSLILKESLLVCFLGVFLYSLNRVITGMASVMTFVIAFIFFLLLFTVKSFVILILIPPLIAFYLCGGMRSVQWILLRWSTVLIFFFLLAVVSSNVSEDISVPHRLYMQQQSSMKFAVFRGDKSYHRPPIIAPCWTSILKRSPEAVLHVFSIPGLTKADTFEKKAAAVENILLTAALIISICLFWKMKTRNFNPVLLCAVFIICFYTVTGLTTVVEGALVRYKLPGLIFISGFTGAVISYRLGSKP